MRLTLRGHSCVRLEKDGVVCVIDPGSFSPAGSAGGADVVLITHGHPDHLDLGAVVEVMAQRPSLQLWAPHDVVPRVVAAGSGLHGRVHVASDGDRFEASGFSVEVLGELHAEVHPDVPRIPNVAYLVDGAVLHPGDSFTRQPPGRQVDVLLLPVSAPWLKLAETIEHSRAVAARRVVPIHDALLSETGRSLVDRVVAGLTPGGYTRLAVGEMLTTD